MPVPEQRDPPGLNAPIPAARLSGFYFAYYAALGAFTPYWSLYLESRGMGVAAISLLMSLWYATRIVAPSTWAMLAARACKGWCSRPRAGALWTALSTAPWAVWPVKSRGIWMRRSVR